MFLCFRFLATGETYESLAFSYRVGAQTIGKIVPEVCRAIWCKLAPLFLRMPSSKEDWLLVAENFYDRWQFPNCCGALDGKHIVTRAPANSGSVFYNFKGSFSIVLLALADANMQFLYVDVGSFGRNSDGGILSHSTFGKALLSEKLGLPPARALPGAPQLGAMPFVFLGDEAFPLQEHLLRPYPGKNCSVDQDAYNYRQSRARRIVESTFGVFASRWRIFYSRIGVAPEVTKKIVKACAVLHNMLQRETTPAQVASILEDFDAEDLQGLRPLARGGNRGSVLACEIRDKFKNYFTQVHAFPWQEAHIRRGCFGDT